MTEEEKEMWEWLDKYHCARCGTVLEDDYEYDHCEECKKRFVIR